MSQKAKKPVMSSSQVVTLLAIVVAVIVPKPGKERGDIYLGGLFGLIAGAVAGLLVAQGLPSSSAISNGWLSEFFLAGLGLKGFSEAVATRRPR